MFLAHWQHVIFGDESRFQHYPVDGRLMVHRFPGDSFQQRCQAYRVQAGGGLVHVWGAFHSGAKSPLVLPGRYLTGELYSDILLVFFFLPKCRKNHGRDVDLHYVQYRQTTAAQYEYKYIKNTNNKRANRNKTRTMENMD